MKAERKKKMSGHLNNWWWLIDDYVSFVLILKKKKISADKPSNKYFYILYKHGNIAISIISQFCL